MRRAVALTLLLGAAALGPGLPARADDPAPATPQRLSLVAGTTAMSLSWEQPRTNPPARWFQVRDGGRVVARNTTTSAVVPVTFNSLHTYTVTAVDDRGRESAPTAAVTGHAFVLGINPECPGTSPLTITATTTTASAASLSWPRHPHWSHDLELRVGGVSLGRTSQTSARIGGLASGTTYSVGLYRYNGCQQRTVPVAQGSLTTAAGSAERPGAPSAPVVTGRTGSTVRLAWTAPAGSPGVPAPIGYAVYDGDTLVARTSSTGVTVGRLYHASQHAFTVTALNAAGHESTHTLPLAAATEPCQANPPRPDGLTATVLSPSSVRLGWSFRSAAVSYTVHDGDRVVATPAGPEAMITGLASGSQHNFRVSATLPNACGETLRGTAVPVTTLPGPAGRAAVPTGLSVTRNAPLTVDTTSLTLAWTPAAGGEPVTGFRVYDGATLAGETTAAVLALTVGAGSRHSYTVVAVDAAGTESAPSPPLAVSAVYMTPP